MDAVGVINQANGDGWTLYNGDVCDVIKGLPDNSVHYSVSSPPFSSLYTYSASERDMGNCKDMAEFMIHFAFLVKELLRVTKPGRLLSMHVMNLPTSKERDGYIGIRDFRGEVIRSFIDTGWIYHAEVTIWKDPVMAMQRTKALGLLHKQIKKDSCMSRQGIPDYVVTFRKPGVNPERVTHTAETFPVSQWQQYASPVWATVTGLGSDGFLQFGNPTENNPDKNGIDPSDTLQSMAESDDERHLCCLQLPVIERCVRLWSNPGDVVLSPFAGVGSEGYVSVKNGRKFIGVELKTAYWERGVKNLKKGVEEEREQTLFKTEKHDALDEAKSEI